MVRPTTARSVGICSRAINRCLGATRVHTNDLLKDNEDLDFEVGVEVMEVSDRDWVAC